jgi:hypothetical protein
MSEDREPVERLADEESALQRSGRFGQLPARVKPEEMVEQVESDSRTDVPEQAFDARTWGEAGRFL